MSDDKKDNPSGQVLPMGTFNGVVPRCPICGNQNWARRVPGDLSKDEKFQEVVVADRNGQLLGMGVMSFICSTCGFVRQHDLGIY